MIGAGIAQRAAGTLTSYAGDAFLGGLDMVLRSELAATAVDRVLASRLAEHTVESALDQIAASPVVERIADAVLDSPRAEQLVAKVIASPLLDAAVVRLLESEELWILVDEIARSPSVTDAISHQSMGVAEEVSDVVRKRSLIADERLERIAHRLVHWRDRARPAPGPTPRPES